MFKERKEWNMGNRRGKSSEWVLETVMAAGELEPTTADAEAEAEAATPGGESNPPAPTVDTSKMTRLQGQYLAYIHNYLKLHRGVAPAQADMQRYFKTAPPNVHNMIVRLESLGFLARTPGKARSLRVLVDPAQIPPLQ